MYAQVSPVWLGLVLAAKSLLLPAAVALAAWAAAPGLAAGRRGGLTLVAGFGAAWGALHAPQISLAARQTLDWLPLLLTALVAAGLAERRGARQGAQAAVYGLGLWLLSPTVLLEAPLAQRAAEWGGALAAGLVLAGLAVAGGTRARPALAAAFGVLGLGVSLEGSAVIGGLASAGFALAALAWLAGARLLAAPGLAAAFAGLWLWLGFSARHLADVGWPLLLAGAACLLTVLIPLPRSGSARRLGGLAYPVLPALAAVGWLAWRAMAAPAGY